MQSSPIPVGRGAAGLYREANCGGSPVCGWGAWLCLETREVAASAVTTIDRLYCTTYVCTYVRTCVLVLYLEVLARLKSDANDIHTYIYILLNIYFQGGRKYIHM